MNEELTQEAADHLRAAALELISAARVILDLTEQLVKDPGPVMAAVAALAAAATANMPDRDSDGARDESSGSDAPSSSARRPRPRVEHIRVS